MEFFVVERVPRTKPPRRPVAFLVRDNWDDWRSYRTQFYLVVYDEEGEKHDIGNLKIGQAGLEAASTVSPGKRVPEIGETFQNLGPQFFSLGQDDTYYESLYELGRETATEILEALRDVAYSPELFSQFRGEDVMGQSLLRFVSSSTVLGKFSRLARGNPALTPFNFEYSFFPQIEGVDGPTLKFKVKPYRQPPTNVHVLIGRNGAGKTRFLQALGSAIVDPESPSAKLGELQLNEGDADEPWAFAGLVYVSFSAFDDFELPPVASSTLKAAQVSLRRGDATEADGEVSRAGVSSFITALSKCRRGLRKERWRDAVRALESDPLFEEANITDLADVPDNRWRSTATQLFSKMSSGHAVVLLTITRLVELVDEHTLVLMDEPEGHLHPPLLSALIRSLSDLLTKRNGVAIIATHSPVVLQEVPKSCVWKLRRAGLTAVAERPELETFGENVGVLTREVFGLEVAASGFHKLIAEAVEHHAGNYEAVLEQFHDQLGAEGRAIARGLAAVMERKNSQTS